MQTKIKVTAYAAQLKKHLAKLKLDHSQALLKHKEAEQKFRADLLAWTEKNYAQRVRSISANDIRAERNNRWGQPWAPPGFFSGCPQPPEYPQDDRIRKIQALLRQLSIAGQTHVTISTDDVATNLMGADEE